MSIIRRILGLTSRDADTAASVAPAAAAPAEPAQPPRQGPITFADLSEQPDPAVVPLLDRPRIDESGLSPEQLAWRRDGVLLLENYIPDDVLDAYTRRREALLTEMPDRYAGGWQSPSPYQHVPELRALSLYPPLMRKMEHLLGEPMMLHLNLTGWVSTDRDWHQDDYLNPSHVNSWYAAVWIALADIDPDAGPFEYIPGSHVWPLLRGDKVQSFLTEEERARRDGPLKVYHWPAYAERFVTPAIEAEIAARGVRPVKFIARRGDVLIWHGRLMHRGSRANVPGMERRSLIAHYSGVNHRPDMPRRATDENGMVYALFDHPLR